MPLQRNPKVVFRPLRAQGGVLLHLETGAYHSLNPSGVLVWERVDGARDADEVGAAVRDAVPDPPADLDAAVASFLEDLRARDLVRAV